MDYRKLYTDKYGNIPSGWEIHHIDFNHKNNSIDNLVALPSSLHRKLHNAYYKYELSKLNYGLNDITLHNGNLGNFTLFMQNLYEYLTVIDECVPYMNIKTIMGMGENYE